jgi:hypothetical protein
MARKSHARYRLWRQVIEGALLAVGADREMAQAYAGATIGLYGSPNAIDYDRFVSSATGDPRLAPEMVREIAEAIEEVMRRHPDGNVSDK